MRARPQVIAIPPARPMRCLGPPAGATHVRACRYAMSLPEWLLSCGVRKLMIEESYGCGIACLAMATGLNYNDARVHFNQVGLGVRRKSRPPFSTAGYELQMAISSTGRLTEMKKWGGWSKFSGLGCLKCVTGKSKGSTHWHWILAFSHPAFGVVVFDPWSATPAFQEPPLDTPFLPLECLTVSRDWIQVEQTFPIYRDVLRSG